MIDRNTRYSPIAIQSHEWPKNPWFLPVSKIIGTPVSGWRRKMTGSDNHVLTL